MKKFILLLVAAMLVVALSSCKGSLEIDPNLAPAQNSSVTDIIS